MSCNVQRKLTKNIILTAFTNNNFVICYNDHRQYSKYQNVLLQKLLLTSWSRESSMQNRVIMMVNIMRLSGMRRPASTLYNVRVVSQKQSFSCGKIGHISRVCKNAKSSQVNEIQLLHDQGANEIELNSVVRKSQPAV